MSPLEEGMAALGLQAEAAAVRRLQAFGELLGKWNRVYNLTRVPADRTISHHILDSLAIVPYLGAAETLIDVGSGAGLPGIPLAIYCPAMSVTLLDSNNKKARFLEQARISLPLSNVTVVRSRAEDYNGRFDVVTSRAFASLADFSRMTAHLLSSRGRALAMKGTIDSDELDEDLSPLLPEAVRVLTVPGISAQRHLVELRRRGGD
ncbi:MAG: 16S rRNA (guanine(527)-N(7))-methyltransferase RsmG [Gammaproteobacteria bacterium]|nr:16S rRNA (guanine(527)-N(7))-methyltransferase RsmG [Gammaproteobacteria bacterium]